MIPQKANREYLPKFSNILDQVLGILQVLATNFIVYRNKKSPSQAILKLNNSYNLT
ncbi:hypothetical protein CYK57_02117 [Actinobacillus pleuropneumoniae]|nr:hypothetical protein CYK57_02117 [Actinobacillus pleuropneumoniae]